MILPDDFNINEFCTEVESLLHVSESRDLWNVTEETAETYHDNIVELARLFNNHYHAWILEHKMMDERCGRIANRLDDEVIRNQDFAYYHRQGCFAWGIGQNAWMQKWRKDTGRN